MIHTQYNTAKAWDYATAAHKGQTYGVYPYIHHISSVVVELMCGLGLEGEYDGGLAVQCALLHDTIEDTESTYNDIFVGFGVAVADGVLALSKDVSIRSKRGQLLDSIGRIKRQPYEVWVVKLADRIANLSVEPPSYWSVTKVLSYIHESSIIHKELGSSNKLLSDRLFKKICEYAQHVEGML